MDAEKLYEVLEKSQKKLGYGFNPDREKVLHLLEGLLTNKKRYGYLGCPCRLAAEDRELDRDITCPCDYREPDVREYGTCYCKLYISLDNPPENLKSINVPERRPEDKIPF
jgi:ferredoxin-thioredoxin reductase catalytic subunit